MKCLSVKEFREFGYLQELNRQFLHPLGLALEVVIDDGSESLGRIWDSRDDPEGIIYEEINITKATNVAATQKERDVARMRKLGYIIQPVSTFPGT